MIPTARPASAAEPDLAPRSADASAWMPMIEKHVPARFAEAEVLERLASRLAYFPPSGLLALELHLGAERPQIDLSQRFDTAEKARSFVARLGDDSLGTLLDPWARGELSRLANVWFETDIPPSGDETARPEVMACVAVEPDAEPLWITDRLAPCFRSGGLTPAQRRTLLDALGHLRDAGGYPIYLFDLESRSTSAGWTRLDTIGLDQPSMVDFLRRFAPERTVRQVASLPTWMNDMERHHLSFDVLPDGEIGDRVGTEMSNVKLPHRDPRWGRLFDGMVADGLCDPETRDQIEAWTGKDDRHTAGELWPEAGELSGGCCVRCISHVKLVARSDRPLEAKVYLLLTFLDAETLERRRRSRSAG